MDAIRRYWFAPADCFDLAVIRILMVATQLFIVYVFYDTFDRIEAVSALADAYWDPLLIMKFLTLPFGWGDRPGLDVLQWVYWGGLVFGMMSLVGLLTNVSLVLFAFLSVFQQAYLYSFGDYHHPEAVMMVALTVLALSPSGRVLSLDAVLRDRRAGGGAIGPLDQTSEFAGWPIRLLRWFLALMYLSAVYSKLSLSGLEWANGYTLQYYLARDGLRWGSDLGVMMSHYHELIRIGQFGVIVFQATFWLAVLFPILRWVYVPAGVLLHLSIYLTLNAAFFQWIVLYAVFIPWSTVADRVLGRRGAAALAPERG